MRLALIALATLFFFGCHTVQVRAGPGLAVPPPPLRVALAEPELDLWIEGSGQVTPQETDQGLQAARAALGASLDRRGFAPAGEADAVLLVHEQGVARTDGRRSGQTAAIVGIVLVVAAIVVLIVASNRGGGGSRAGPAGPVRAAPPRAGFRPGYRPYPPAPGPWFGWGVSWGVHFEVPLAPAPAWVPALPPTLEARLPSRGFFAGDETEIALELHRAQSGEVLWSRVVREEVDPRDPAAVRALVERAIAGEPWAASLGAPPPAAPAPAPTPERQAPPGKPSPPRVEVARG